MVDTLRSALLRDELLTLFEHSLNIDAIPKSFSRSCETEIIHVDSSFERERINKNRCGGALSIERTCKLPGKVFSDGRVIFGGEARGEMWTSSKALVAIQASAKGVCEIVAILRGNILKV